MRHLATKSEVLVFLTLLLISKTTTPNIEEGLMVIEWRGFVMKKKWHSENEFKSNSQIQVLNMLNIIECNNIRVIKIHFFTLSFLYLSVKRIKSKT